MILRRLKIGQAGKEYEGSDFDEMVCFFTMGHSLVVAGSKASEA